MTAKRKGAAKKTTGSGPAARKKQPRGQQTVVTVDPEAVLAAEIMRDAHDLISDAAGNVVEETLAQMQAQQITLCQEMQQGIDLMKRQATEAIHDLASRERKTT